MAEWRVGDVVDERYRILKVHEHGGMGVVYRARHLEWDIDLAVKSPRPELLRRPEHRDQFVDEAETWVSLGLHPHVCSCFYVRVLDGVPRVFAEYVEGGSLRDWIDDRRLYHGDNDTVVARIIDIAIQTAWGLEHAHGRGLVHRDVKPGNVLLEPVGDAVTAKITDFGLARVRTVDAPPPGDAPPGVSVLVPGGGGMTTAYASPEQAERLPLGRRTDVYSFAVSVLEMFTGGISWVAGPVAGAALAAHRPGGGLPDLPPDLAGLLGRCLAAAPADRPGSMAVVAAELAGISERLTGREYPRPAPVAADLRADELNNRALSLLDLDRPDEAAKAFEEALAADPQHLPATYNSGLTRWRGGAITDEDLVARLDRVRASTGDPWPARLRLAQVQLERGDLGAAGELLDGLARDAPGEPEVQATLSAARSGQAVHARGAETAAMTWQSEAMELWKVAKALGRMRVPANPIHVAPGPRTALTGSHDTKVRLWDVRTGRCRRTFEGHTGIVLAVGISPKGRFGVSADEDDTIRVWDLTGGRPPRALDTPPHDRKQLLDCAVRVSDDGRFVLWAGDGLVALWDLGTGRRTVLHRGSFGAAIELTGDGRLALFADSSRIRVWSPEKLRGSQTGDAAEPQSVTALCVSADWRTVVTSAAHDGTIRVWDLMAGKCVRTLTGHTAAVHALALSADGRSLMSGSEDSTVRWWDAETGSCRRTLRGPADYIEVHAVVLDEPARSGLSVSADNLVRQWTMPGGYQAAPQLSRPRPHGELHRLRAQVEAQVDEAEQALAAGDRPRALDLLTRVRSTPGYERAPRVLTAWRALAGSTTRTGLRAAWPTRTLTTGPVYAADISRDGRLAVTAGSDSTIRVWELGGGSCLRVIDTTVRDHPASAVSLSADGRQILAGCGDHTVRLWDVASGECLQELTGNAHNAHSLRFAPGGGHALVGAWGGAVQLWNLATGEPRWTVDAHTERRHGSSAGVTDVWADPAGRLVASAGHDGAVRLADLGSGRELRTIAAHRGVITSMSLSPDGRFALTSGGYGDRAIRLWDVATGERVREFDSHWRHEPNTIRFTTDGRFAVSSGWDATVRVWDVGTGTCLQILEGHRKGVGGVAVSAAGHTVLSWDIGDATARLWELDWELAVR
ncbi:protein kinase [Dactylosporangium sp. AC04546]|uniref:protein kinase domain-containing protein n=1 Tax=Dactylosporangium sp. AC04546 TaxID=2862460 RepID=UPI001EE0417D|nr:protein kinase [Dactylosporangium sp. AC04546]WVK88429.1 protein kinase [Dactylosporangium sp. AC04546]